MKMKEIVDKWFIIALLPAVILLSIELSRHYQTMNSLEVAGVIINVILTIGLLAIYWEMSSTQDQQREIMDKQENLMAANHAPKLHIYKHDIHQQENGVSQSYFIQNEGEGAAENLRAGCQILLRTETEPFPFYQPMESFGIHSHPNPLHRLREEEEPTELSGESWLNTYDPSGFWGDLSFFELDMGRAKSNAIKGLLNGEKFPMETEGEFGLTFGDLMERLPVEDVDAVTFRFFIEYEYGDGRSAKKEAPIFVTPVDAIEECESFSEAIDQGYRMHDIAPASFAESDSEYI